MFFKNPCETGFDSNSQRHFQVSRNEGAAAGGQHSHPDNEQHCGHGRQHEGSCKSHVKKDLFCGAVSLVLLSFLLFSRRYAMNRQVNLPAMQRIMMQFEKEGDMMEMKQELMDDTIDDVMAQVEDFFVF